MTTVKKRNWKINACTPRLNKLPKLPVQHETTKTSLSKK